MTPKDISDVILNTTGVMALAIIALWMLNAVWKARLRDAQNYTESVEKMRQTLLEVVRDNTKAVQSLVDQLRSK